jgi:hypothetical protein
MKIIIDNTIKPKFPPCIFRYESGGLCECGSSFHKKFLFFDSKYCTQPNCDNYYKGFPSVDVDYERAVYIDGKLEFQWTFEWIG